MSIQRIKEAVSLPALIGEYVTLRPIGKEHIGLCPFHVEKTPSLRVHSEYWKCFGCGAGGDCITFVSLIDGISKGAAIKILSDRTGIALDGRRVTRAERTYNHEEQEFCVWWQRRAVERISKQLTAYVLYATEEDCETLGLMLRQLRSLKGIELRALVARAATEEDRAQWIVDKRHTENVTNMCVEILCLAN